MLENYGILCRLMHTLEGQWRRPLEDPVTPPRWQDVINAQRCRQLRHQPAEGWQTVTGCLIGAAEGRDFLMHARDRTMRP